jgi:Glucose / Sorbosone dehydrogenase
VARARPPARARGRARRRALTLAAALALVTPGSATAAPTLVRIGDFSAPVHVASPPGDARVFVVEQGGLVKIVGGGTFLDVTTLTDGGGERGLLSIAFAPDYPASGRVYVFLTARADGALRIIEYRRSAGDPSRADPASARPLLTIPHPGFANHNGGQLQFGPDGMLYVGTGDGGGGNDPDRNAQNLSSELGKLLRIDPVTGGAAAGNPFGSRVWSYGLRNPWRFSFDRATGDLVIGDVGQGALEEVDWAPASVGGGRGANFGWPCFEGLSRNVACEAPGAVGPAFERSHGAGYCSIIGGYVVRDPGLPTLAGRYLYGDYCLPGLRSTVLAGDPDRPEPLPVAQLTSLGEDTCGRLYATSHAGPVYRIQDGPPPPCAAGPPPGSAPQPPPASPAADRVAPRLAVTVAGLRSATRRRRLLLRARCDEACAVTAGGRLRGVGSLRRARRTLPAAARRLIRLRIRRATARRLRGAIGRHGRVIAAITVRGRDGAGNERVVRRRVQVRG